MKVIELDGAYWTDPGDFWTALKEALGVVPGHGTNFAAFEDSVFYANELLSVRPPFSIVVYDPAPVTLSDVENMARGWAEQREWKREHYGEDVQATLVIHRR